MWYSIKYDLACMNINVPLKNILSSLLYLTTSKSSLLIKSLINNLIPRLNLDNLSLMFDFKVFVVVCILGATFNLNCCDLFILNCCCCLNRITLKELRDEMIAMNKI